MKNFFILFLFFAFTQGALAQMSGVAPGMDRPITGAEEKNKKTEIGEDLSEDFESSLNQGSNLGPLEGDSKERKSDSPAKSKKADVKQKKDADATKKTAKEKKELEKLGLQKAESEKDGPMSEGSADASKKSSLMEKSSVEDVFFGKFPTSISRDLRQFGYDIFSKKPSSFTPLEDIPISPDYIVGPGDSFTVSVWGTANFSSLVTVRRDGSIFIPKVGAIKVWGKPFKEVSSAIEKRLTSYFSGIKVSVSFDSIRHIDVFVIGEVKQPGSFSISSTSSAINALFHAGGPTKNGSLRNIQLLRDNKLIETIDLYDFLISGKADKNLLQSQDVILVPVVGKMVAVAGNVKRPAIYEIKGHTTLLDMIAMAGGLTFTGETGRLSLERVNQNKERITRDFQIPENFGKTAQEKSEKSDLTAEVMDGDLIKIFPVLTPLRKTVFLRGHVKRPGSYEFKEGMTVKTLIPSFDSLLPEPYTEYAQIIRVTPPRDEKLSLFTPLKRLMDGDLSADLPLQERDEVVVFSKEELNLQETVNIAGKVNKPGIYLYFDGMRLKDLIFMAGNLTQDAYLANAEIARYRVENDELKLERLQVNLREALSSEASKQNPVLQPKDRIFVQGLPNWKIENFVTIAGEVRYPGQYPFLPGERLSSVIERAGGFTKKAFLSGALFTRASVKILQEKALKEQISQLEESVIQESVRPSQYLSASDLQTYQAAMTARKEMLKKLEMVEVTGRMLIRLSDLSSFKNSAFDIPLEPNDSLTVPTISSVVTVSGEVYNPASMVFIEGKPVQYYLERAGGATPNADNESIFVVKADGSVISKRQNRGFLLRNFYQTEIERGDSILVPKDISQFSWLNTTKDLTEILFKIASTTGITITALK
jgi:protein involved in polysaccharide export with SLBB domain